MRMKIDAGMVGVGGRVKLTRSWDGRLYRIGVARGRFEEVQA